jgi:hypothetical protein
MELAMKEMDDILDSLTQSIDQSIRDFLKCKDINQRKTHAETIKLLCESMGVFFNAIGNHMSLPFDNFDIDDYEDEEEYEFTPHRKSKNKKKTGKGEIPF